MKIAIISCYDQIDYIRTLTLRPAFASMPGVNTLVIKNKNKGLMRYLEVPLRVLKSRFKDRPDVWVITFRGYEMLPFLLLVKGRKPLIFDEYINAAEYLMEHDRLKIDSLPGRLFMWFYVGLLKRCRFILADTEAHAKYSANLSKLDQSRFRALPVGADEKLFYPGAAKYTPDKSGKFKIFYYGVNMRLHGLEHITEAAVMVAKTHPNVEFTISDPKGKNYQMFKDAIARGANIKVISGWVPFETLPKRQIEADLCLGGPFGKTLQSQFVITTKTYQYLACGAPALIAQNAASSDYFADKKNCLMVPQADAKALAKAIGWAADHPKELRAIGREGRKLYEEHFSLSSVTKEVQRMVGELK